MLAAAVVGKPQQGLQPGELPPAVTTNQGPKPLRHSALQPVQLCRAGGPKHFAVLGDRHLNWLAILDHGNERTRVAVVAGNQVQHEVAVDFWLNYTRAYRALDQSYRDQLVPCPLGVSALLSGELSLASPLGQPTRLGQQ